MKTLLLISFLLIVTCSDGQMTLQDIENTQILNRIEFIKSKTDSFLLMRFNKNIKRKFQYEFLNCGYFQGEYRYIYQFLNSDKPKPDDLNRLTHNYSFLDKDINLRTDVDIWFYQYKNIEMEFQTTADSLKYVALDKIYNNGLIKRIKTKIVELRLRNPYTIIQVDEKSRTFNVILRDRAFPHNYFVS